MKIKRNRNWMWGILLLLSAAGIVANQLGWLWQFGFWTMVAAVLAVVFLIACLTQRTISTLPFFIAMVYIVLRDLGFVPHVSLWAILIAAGLTSAGIGLLFPQKIPKGVNVVIGSFCDADDEDEDDWDEESEESRSARREKARASVGGIDNNPVISVNFGSISRYIHADRLETVTLSCNFGGMEIYLDQAELSPNGATIHLDCKFGGIDIYVPRHWRINEQISCNLGGVDINKRNLANVTEDSPELTITGIVTCGGVDIWYI